MYSKSIVFAVLLTLSLSLSAQSGISFVQMDSWSQVLEKAAAEEKLIFMDAYTTWCGPCKMMNSNIFPLEEVGAFYNANFVNVKIDMEKGEGIDLAKTYSVNAYPTFLFVNAEGKLVHKGLGYQEVESFLDLGRAALDPSQQFGTLSQSFTEGSLEGDQLLIFAQSALQVNEQKLAGQAASLWFEGQSDQMKPEVLNQLLDFVFSGPGSPIFEFVAANREKIGASIGSTQVDESLKSAIINSARMSGEYSVETVHAQLHNAFPEPVATMFADEYTMIYHTYFNRNDLQRKKEATRHYLNTYIDKIKDWDVLNSAAWDVFEAESNDREENLQALNWVKKSLELDENYFNTDTAASLCYRLGMKAEGIQFAEMAISLGQESGMSVSATQELLEKLLALD
jgi:thiol-disulfide isomerase/thioredoxin